MEVLKVNYKNPDQRIIKKVALAIRRGEVAVVPGDAVYTLVTSSFSKEGIAKINRLKRRQTGKFFTLGLYCLEDINNYAFFNPVVLELKNAFVKEPFTFILKRRPKKTPEFLNPGAKKLGFRVPFNKVTSSLSKFHRLPVVASSANISGQPNSYDIKRVLNYFSDSQASLKPDIVIDAGPLTGRRPSTVLDLSEKRIRIIRLGELSKQDVLKFSNNYD